MFARVLVPLDGSEAALAALDYAAAIPSESVRLLSVVPMSGALAVPAALAGRHDDWLTTVKANAAAKLDEAAATLTRQGRAVETRVEVGDPAERIVEAAADVDLIVMTTHGLGAGGRVIYGSVADRVVRHAPAPVSRLTTSGCTQCPRTLAPPGPERSGALRFPLRRPRLGALRRRGHPGARRSHRTRRLACQVRTDQITFGTAAHPTRVQSAG